MHQRPLLVMATAALLAAPAMARVNVTPTVTKTIVVFTIARADAAAESVTGIHYDKTLAECTAPNTDASASTTAVDASTRKTLDTSPWTVTCVRKSQPIGGDAVYPALDVVVVTTAGPFTHSIPAETRLAYQFASDMQQKIDALNARFGKIGIGSVRSKYPSEPGPCPSGTRFTGWTVYNTYPGGRSGQGTAERVCLSTPE